MARNALVLDCHPHTLTVVRSLSRAGHGVTVGISSCDTARDYVHLSRYANSSWAHPAIVDEPKEFESALFEYLDQHPELDVIYPVGENSSRCLARVRGRIPAHVVVVMPDNEILETCLDKPTACRVAEQSGIPVPETRRARSLEEVRRAIDDIGFPCILKSDDSRHMLLGKKCIFLRTESNLRILPNLWRESPGSVTVQREIRGRRYNCDVVARNGEIQNYFESEILRTDRPDYSGISVSDRSVPPDTGRRSYCEKLVARLNYTGIALIQFLKEERTGQSYFLEANPRTGATIALAVHCGIDLPANAVLACQHDTQATDVNYPPNRYQYWLVGDLVGLRRALIAGDVQARQIPGSLVAVVSSWYRANCHRTFAMQDARPTLKIVKNLLYRLIS